MVLFRFESLVMFSLRRPEDACVRDMLDSVKEADFTYDAIGCLQRSTPPGFSRDRHTVVLGCGEVVWANAQAAMRAWAVFPEEMVSVVRLTDDLEVGNVLATVCHAAGLWTVNPTRILSVIDQTSGDRNRYGFAFGTLPGHVVLGEESFTIECDTATDEVTYTIEAVSRPRHPLLWLAYPYARMFQARFRQLSGRQVQQRVQRSSANIGV